MAGRQTRILLVVPDPILRDMLAETCTGRFGAGVTSVADASEALRIDLGEPHEAVVADLRLPPMDGLALAEQFVSFLTPQRPFVLLADRLTVRQAIQAMRLGIRDVFIKPFALPDLMDRLAELLSEFELRRQFVNKYHRMRELIRRVLRERRALNRRTEFVCRDLVGAHRRLVSRVLAFERNDQQQPF
jgi:DNA-binding NtrC family response regulator